MGFEHAPLFKLKKLECLKPPKRGNPFSNPAKVQIFIHTSPRLNINSDTSDRDTQLKNYRGRLVIFEISISRIPEFLVDTGVVF